LHFAWPVAQTSLLIVKQVIRRQSVGRSAALILSEASKADKKSVTIIARQLSAISLTSAWIIILGQSKDIV
jgi:hypothetical protein